jgi:hypothetical protein
MEYLKLVHDDYRGVSINWEEGIIYLQQKPEGAVELKCDEIVKHLLTSKDSPNTLYIFKYPEGVLSIFWYNNNGFGRISFNDNIETSLNNLRSWGYTIQTELPFIYNQK